MEIIKSVFLLNWMLVLECLRLMWGIFCFKSVNVIILSSKLMVKEKKLLFWRDSGIKFIVEVVVIIFVVSVRSIFF